jgi:hypothetical protein
MIFVRTQALDNVSNDQCVLDGELLDAASLAASPGMALLSDTVRDGRAYVEAGYEITSGRGCIVVKLPTAEVDSIGRRASAVAVFSRDELADLRFAADVIADYAGRLDRTVDSKPLALALVSWDGQGKAHGPLHRVGRYLSRVTRRMLRASWDELRAAWRTLFDGQPRIQETREKESNDEQPR